MKGMIYTNSYTKTPQITYQIDRLIKEFDNRGVTVTPLNDVNLIVSDKIFAKANFDFCVFLDKDKYVARALEKLGMRLFNSSKAIEVCDDKMLTQLALVGVCDMPKSIPAPLCYNKTTVNEDFINRVQNELGYPLIVKESYGSMGKQIYKANNKDELVKIANQLICVPHFYQQFIKESEGRDIRVIVIGKKVFAWYTRINEFDFRSNLASGAKAVNCELTKEQADLAVRVASALKLDYCGIDILFGKKPLLCEVNSNAFFTGAEQITNKNIAGEYANYILKELGV